jgi:hypothetical protein
MFGWRVEWYDHLLMGWVGLPCLAFRFVWHTYDMACKYKDNNWNELEKERALAECIKVVLHGSSSSSATKTRPDQTKVKQLLELLGLAHIKFLINLKKPIHAWWNATL